MELVGREREVASLVDAFHRARAGSRQLCLISGDAGPRDEVRSLVVAARMALPADSGLPEASDADELLASPPLHGGGD
ncbi:MAG TPA: hypothetical protein VFY23_04220 [Candidatus Limnocylindrales bacterium]|nr:hypothetical protein [Candidatus Limnocylindrales bacterium]